MFALIFDSVGVGEWLVLLAVLLIVVGPKRLPAVARSLGAKYSRFRRAAENFKRQLLEMDSDFARAADEARRAAEAMEREAADAFTPEPPGEKPPPLPNATEMHDGLQNS